MDQTSVASKKNSPPAQQGSESPQEEDKYRSWTQFELNTVFALVCKHEHLKKRRGKPDYKGFAEKLNTALNYHDYSDTKPIKTEDAKAIIQYLYTRRKGAMRFVERQIGPLCLTRKQRHVLMRELDFDGTKTEWIVQGRRKRVMAERAKHAARGTDYLIRTSTGLKIDRFVPHYAQKRSVDHNDDRLYPADGGHNQQRYAEEIEVVDARRPGDPYDNGSYRQPYPSTGRRPQQDAQTKKLWAIIEDADRQAPKTQKSHHPGNRVSVSSAPVQPPMAKDLLRSRPDNHSSKAALAETPTSPMTMITSPEYHGPPATTPMPTDSNWADIIEQARHSIHPTGPLPTSPMAYSQGPTSPLSYFQEKPAVASEPRVDAPKSLMLCDWQPAPFPPRADSSYKPVSPLGSAGLRPKPNDRFTGAPRTAQGRHGGTNAAPRNNSGPVREYASHGSNSYRDNGRGGHGSRHSSGSVSSFQSFQLPPKARMSSRACGSTDVFPLRRD
ncbi:hypothetical protein F5X99DRAFT_424322 [Biscogniauxia marginata]|nr:hypothetical protein F5X99DRAFT_424322 [Biscogniauxia marginata]